MPSNKRTFSEEEDEQYLRDAYSMQPIKKKKKDNKEDEGPSWKPGPVSKHHKTTHKYSNWEELDEEEMRGNAGNTRRLKNKKPKKKPKKKKPKKKKDTRKRKASMNARGNKSTPPPRSPPPSPPRKSMTRREILKNPILPKLSRKYKPKKGKFGYM